MISSSSPTKDTTLNLNRLSAGDLKRKVSFYRYQGQDEYGEITDLTLIGEYRAYVQDSIAVVSENGITQTRKTGIVIIRKPNCNLKVGDLMVIDNDYTNTKYIPITGIEVGLNTNNFCVISF